jgi:hypothetical protein
MESYFLSHSRGQASQSMITLTDNDLTIYSSHQLALRFLLHMLCLEARTCAYWGTDSAVSQIELQYLVY